MTEIKEIWEYFIAYFQKKGVTISELGFQKGTNEKEILRAEKTLLLKFPEDYREFLKLCNGQNNNNNYLFWLPDGMRLYGILDIISEYQYQLKLMKEVPDPLEFFNKCQFDDKIRAIVFHEKWIPIAGYELKNCWIFIDNVPGPKGVEGQLVHNITECDFIVLVKNFTELIKRYIHLLENGSLKVEREDYKDLKGYALKTIEGKYLNGESFLNLIKMI